MEEIPNRRRSPWMLILGTLLAGLYIYSIIWRGGILQNLAGIVFDAILLLFLVQVTVFFYAQFTLPIRTLRDRFKLKSRVWLHWRRAQGPAIFVKNGREVARPAELERHGPGLIWVDSASAVVTWSGMGQKQVLGPGVHFTDGAQKIGRTFSLHVQTCNLGPNADEPIFAALGEQASEDQRKRHAYLQAIRTAVSGRTRDGNEVVPMLSLSFRLDAKPAADGQPGSRFGFSARSVERASRSEGINADPEGSQPAWVAWNQLPGLMAIDLWREYLSKFTLDELFQPHFPPLPDVPQPSEPPEPAEIPSKPLVTKRGLISRLLRRLNNAVEARLEQREVKTPAEVAAGPAEGGDTTRRAEPERRYTAFQVIEQMVERRLTQAAVPVLDDCGRVLEGYAISPEFARLKERGLAVNGVTIQNLRFDPAVEKQIIQLWNTGWLVDAENERQQVEQLERLAGQNGRKQALQQHALLLGRAVQHDQPANMEAAVKALLQATEFEVVSDPRLYAQATEEANQLATLLRWVESGENE